MKQNEIEQLLPEVYRRSLDAQNPLGIFLASMEAQHEPAEAAVEDIDLYFDSYRAPDEFIPFLAKWVDLDRLLVSTGSGRGVGKDETPQTLPFLTGLGRLRELIRAAAHLSKWRGTHKGLLLFLETATGVSGFALDEQVADEEGNIRPFHLRISAPASTEPVRPLIERIIEMEKPAYVTYELHFQ